jgi:hypothetical protein
MMSSLRDWLLAPLAAFGRGLKEPLANSTLRRQMAEKRRRQLPKSGEGSFGGVVHTGDESWFEAPTAVEDKLSGL